MRTQLPPTALARDARFHRITTADRFADERMNGAGEERRMDPSSNDVADRARRQMHGIFVGEIQAMEGAGRTALDPLGRGRSDCAVGELASGHVGSGR